METKFSYVEEFYHSQLSIFIGVSKEDSWQMLKAWVGFFEDAELLGEAGELHEDMYAQQKLLTGAPVLNDDDKDMN